MEYGALNRRRASWTSAGGDGPPPTTMARMPDRSWSSKSGCRSSRAIWAATPFTAGRRWCSSRSSRRPASHRSMTWIVAPEASCQGSFVITPTCADAVPATRCPPDPQAPPESISAMAASWRLVNQAPRGSPVDPDVKQMQTARPGSSARSGTLWWATRSVRSMRPGSSVGVTSSTARSSGSPPARDSVASTRAGSTVSATRPRSRARSRGFAPAVTAPTLAAAR